MKDKILNIFSATECPSEEVLIQYFENKISEEQRHTVEFHLTDCEICQDLLEGLSQMKNTKHLPEIVFELNLNVDKKIDKQPKIIKINFRKVVSIAASIILIFSLSYFVSKYFIKTSKHDISESLSVDKAVSEKQSETYDETKKVELDENLDSKVTDDISNPDVIKQQPLEEEKITSEKTLIQNEDFLKDEISVNEDIDDVVGDRNVIDVDNLEAKKFENNITGRTEVVDITTGTDSNTGEEVAAKELSSYDFAMVETVAMEQESTKKSKIINGFDDFSKERYSEAKADFDDEISVNPANDTAVFYKGLSEFQLQNFKEADSLFDTVLQNTNSSFYEDALYFKALTYINLGYKKSAIKFLNQVVNLNGKYTLLAKQKLAEIE